MECYFRAVSWLQAIPFRLEPDEELAAFFLMGQALGELDAKLRRDMTAFCGTYSEFLGNGNEWDIVSLQPAQDEFDHIMQKCFPKDYSAKEIQSFRETYEKFVRSGQLNDQLRFPPTTKVGNSTFSFRVLPSFALPDSLLFQYIMNPSLGQREFPTGLEICAALGSPFAKAKFAKA